MPSTPTVQVTKVFTSHILIQTTFLKTVCVHIILPQMTVCLDYPSPTSTLQIPFNISEGIAGSASSYTIIYSDFDSHGSCDSIKIPAVKCQGSICNHIYDVSSSSCYNATNISVAVSATNLLGDGPTSHPVSIELYHYNSTSKEISG